MMTLSSHEICQCVYVPYFEQPNEGELSTHKRKTRGYTIILNKVYPSYIYVKYITVQDRTVLEREGKKKGSSFFLFSNERRNKKEEEETAMVACISLLPGKKKVFSSLSHTRARSLTQKLKAFLISM